MIYKFIYIITGGEMNDLNLFISVKGDNAYLVDDNCTRLKR